MSREIDYAGLDRWITGNYGEDFFRDEEDEDEDEEMPPHTEAEVFELYKDIQRWKQRALTAEQLVEEFREQLIKLQPDCPF